MMIVLSNLDTAKYCKFSIKNRKSSLQNMRNFFFGNYLVATG